MAHDHFLGTFNKSQFLRFVQFARSQLPSVAARIQHLRAELSRTGSLRFTFGVDHLPTTVTADPSDSYLGKLLAAYQVMGGNPFFDVRSREKDQAIFVPQGTAAHAPTSMSSGEVMGAKGLQDAFSGELVRKLRSPIQATLDYRFSMLERKMRRAIDYAEQLEDEIASLELTQAAATTKGSLEFIANQVQQLISDRNYRAIYDDQSTDPVGLNTYAPFSQYDVEAPIDPIIGAPNRAVEYPQRQDSGFVGPGGKGS
jgi:hypothetical protein